MSLMPFPHYITPAGGQGSVRMRGLEGIKGPSLTAPGTGDFTVEAWVYIQDIAETFNSARLFGLTDDTTGGVAVYLDTNNNRLRVFHAGSTLNSASSSVSADTWYHIAVVRSSTTLTLYIDGSSSASNTNSDNITTAIPFVSYRDSNTTATIFPWRGHLQKFRYSNTARYTSTFTSDTAYGSDANTLFMLYSPDGVTVEDSEGGSLTISNVIVTSLAASTFSPDSVGASTWPTLTTDWKFAGACGDTVEYFPDDFNVDPYKWTGMTAANLDDTTNSATTGSQSWAASDQARETFFDQFSFSDSDFSSGTGDATDYYVYAVDAEITFKSTNGFVYRIFTDSWSGNVKIINTGSSTDSSGTTNTTVTIPVAGVFSRNVAPGDYALSPDTWATGTEGAVVLFKERDANPFTDELFFVQFRLRLRCEAITE